MGSNEKKTSLRIEIIEKLAVLVTAAFGLVAALAWNEAIKSIFKQIYGPGEEVAPMVIYAVTVTAIAVIVTIIVGRAKGKAIS
ncbi:MAG: DUF5654 family protein [Nitrososphaerales archaeon]